MAKKLTLAQRALSTFSQMTLLLVLAFGGITTLTLLEAPSRSISMSSEGSSSAKRQPASSRGDIMKASEATVATLKVSCLSGTNLKTTAQHVRLLTEGCLEHSELRVSNETRKTTAMVFHQQGRQTTDYLGLAMGENVIVVEQSLEGQSTTVRHTILRE